MNHFRQSRTQQAVTLIELLVVIAIIAILAAILFPVFAQAKASAKATACVSNMKQIATAALMYPSDYDDHMVIAQSWYATAPINGQQFTKDGIPFNSWRSLLYPYTKSSQIYVDPTASNIFQSPALSSAPSLNAMFYGNLGINHMGMAPMYYDGTNQAPIGLSSTSVSKPAETVYFTEMYSNGVDNKIDGNWVWDGNWWQNGMVDAPECWDTNLSGTDPNQVDGNVFCYWNWGTGVWDTGYGLDNAHGGDTGFVTPRVANKVVTVWGDGHCSKPALGELAAGTTWYMGINSNDTHFVPGQTDKYHWNPRPTQ